MEPTSFHFFQSFRDLHHMPRNKDRISTSKGYFGFLSQKLPRSPESIPILSKCIIGRVIKPQKLLLDEEDYYVGLDMYTHTYYMCCRYLMMIDIDFYKDDETLTEEQILKRFNDYTAVHPDKRFSIFRSQNGIHAFLTSEHRNFRDHDSLQTMIDLGCDFNYIIYSYLRGWSVRLNRKKIESTAKPLYTYICDIGTGSSLPELTYLIKIHIDMSNEFKDYVPSEMYGGPTTNKT